MLAYEYAYRNGIEGFSDVLGLAGRSWAEAFQKRWEHEITLKKAHNLSNFRAMAVNPSEMDDWFKDLIYNFKDAGVMDEEGNMEPDRIWNADETPLPNIPKE